MFGDIRENFKPRDGDDRNLRWLGEAFDGAEPDAHAGEAAGTVDGNDGGDVVKLDIVLREQFRDCSDQRG